MKFCLPTLLTALMAAWQLGLAPVQAGTGAMVPWTTYEAEAMKTTGTVQGPRYDPFLIETESSGQQFVRLDHAGEYVELIAQKAANSLVVRYSLPDSPLGGGLNTTLRLCQNGRPGQPIALTSHYAWLYDNYPFNNNPKDGRPRNFYDEVRVTGLNIKPGDTLRLIKAYADPAYCIIDLVDLEAAPAALPAPAKALSILDFGATGNGETDDTEALRQCLAAAREQKKIAWVPAGTYKLTGDILCETGARIQGAGMWHTRFVGDADLYNQPDRRVRFKLKGSDIHLADFAIIGKLTYRNDDEANDGIHGAGCTDCTVTGIWVEHTKVGMWFYNGTRVTVSGCRFRNTLADGINLCVGCRDFLVENCAARGTGDDCFAIWPTVSDQGYTEETPSPGNNCFRHCTAQVPFLANGGAIYGGKNNRMEGCLFQDIAAGSGILLSTTFPIADEKLKKDNNFSGTTVVRDCEVVRSGGFDHGWGWRAAVQLCLHHRSIAGLEVSGLRIRDSLSDGLGIVAPGSAQGQGTLSAAQVTNLEIPNCGLAVKDSHGLSIREDARGGLSLKHAQVVTTLNRSASFIIATE
ncbi:MAG TPA: glycosyl hydrolase family 28-related protein [Verrucomicrobiae bacterium]